MALTYLFDYESESIVNLWYKKLYTTFVWGFCLYMLTPELDQRFRSVDYTQFLPMGRARGMTKAVAASLSPSGIRSGAAAFEREVAQHQLRQRAFAVQERARQRALAAKAKLAQDFKKVWGDSMGGQLISNFVNRRPFIRYKNNQLP